MKTARMIVIVAIVACGGTAKQGSSTPENPDDRNRPMSHMGGDHQMGHGKSGEKHHEAGMPPQITKFHDTLAPRWHAEHGPQRMTDTCAAIPQFHSEAEAIAAAKPPSEGDASAWSKGGKQLTEAVAALDATCKNKDAQAFEPAFERVHEAFHGVMEAAGGGHHGKGEKSEHKH